MEELYVAIIAITAVDVGMMLSRLTLENFFKAGTIINPPPTPKSPDKKPVSPPVRLKDRAHLLFQRILFVS